MEFMLVVVAAVSLALAAIMSTVAWRLLRDTKVRTRNRAEALVALLHAGEKPAPKPAADPTWTPATAVKTPSTGGSRSARTSGRARRTHRKRASG